MKPGKFSLTLSFLFILFFSSIILGTTGKKMPADFLRKAFVSPYNDTFPVPPKTDKLLFYLQRSKNKNTIVYELNKLPDGRIDKDNPVHIYWRRYAFAGDSVEITYIQNKFAYGVESEPMDKGNYKVTFVSYSKRAIIIGKDEAKGVYTAYTKINGKQSVLDRIFLKLNGGTFWFPSIEYVELDGRDMATNEMVTERIKP